MATMYFYVNSRQWNEKAWNLTYRKLCMVRNSVPKALFYQAKERFTNTFFQHLVHSTTKVIPLELISTNAGNNSATIDIIKQNEVKITPLQTPKQRSFSHLTLVSDGFSRQVSKIISSDQVNIQLTSEGCGGVYFIREENESSTPLAIFKPQDEEFMAPNNPRGYVKEGAIVGVTEHPVKKGFKVGTGAIREQAAYMLDAQYGHFSGVPVTTMLEIPVPNTTTTTSSKKRGSVQQFVPSESSAEDMGTIHFDIEEVHKIGILDIRLFNTDRHAGNILLSNGKFKKYKMTPIDHGLVLPSYEHLDGANFDWLYWSQSKFPFHASSLQHIAALNHEEDGDILRSIGIEEDAIVTMQLCTILLQKGAANGYCLFDIANLIHRDGAGTEPSPLETMISKAEQCVASNGMEKSSAFYSSKVVGLVTEAINNLFEDHPKSKARSLSNY